jgi:hypothetical protein
MDEFDVEDMLNELRGEIAQAVSIIAACVANAALDQPGTDESRFVHVLDKHLSTVVASAPDSFAAQVAEEFKGVCKGFLPRSESQAKTCYEHVRLVIA